MFIRAWNVIGIYTAQSIFLFSCAKLQSHRNKQIKLFEMGPFFPNAYKTKGMFGNGAAAAFLKILNFIFIKI